MGKFFALLFCCAATAVSAQTPFQGRVMYNLHTPREKTDAVLTAYFGVQKLRLEFSEKGKAAENDILVIALDSGAVIHLNNAAKTFRVKKLVKRDLSNYKGKQIAGYATSPKANLSSFGDGMTELFNQSVFYIANDLHYPVAEYYKGNMELMVISDDKVVLGADIVYGPNVYKRELSASDSAEIEQNRISAEAVEVKPYHPEDSLFVVPADFTPEPSYDAYGDTTAVYNEALDSIAVPQPATPKKKKTKPANKKTGTQKSTPHRRKNG